MAQQEAKQEATKVVAARELNTELLRLTAFLAPSAQPTSPTWWADLVGTQPETMTSKPGRGELQQAGALGNSSLTLSLQPGRVDWFLTQRIEEGVLPERRWAGLFQNTLDIFMPLMGRWLENCPGLVRLAFGATVHEPVQDRTAGYRKLAHYLPAIQLDPEHSEDFFYQINRPRSSAVIETLKMNRLSKWSVAVFVPFRIGLNPQHVIPQAAAGPGEHTLRVEVDLSTDAAFVGELPKTQLPQLLSELGHLATELVTQGDIP